MQALSLPPNSLYHKGLMTWPHPLTHHRAGPGRLAINCPYNSRPAITGVDHADWKGSCTTLSGKEASESVTVVNSHETLYIATSGTTAAVDNLPKPLSSDLSRAPAHGNTLRVAYQGIPDAHSEAAGGKAYPGCEAIPCDRFEVLFQAVELWTTDSAVLPVENSLGGSIHRNYDLLLRHRLHIVGEFQLPVHHCLLALPGVGMERLTRVISHPQALAQCEITLTKLGLTVAREAVENTAVSTKSVAANGILEFR